MKKTENNERLCDQEGCELIATHTLVWAKHQYYCAPHTQKVLGVADFMGFPTPAATVRKLEAHEMLGRAKP